MILVLLPCPASAKAFRVSTTCEASESAGKLLPGYGVGIANGAWTTQEIRFRADGTVERPITMRVETRGETILTGESSLWIEGQHIVVSGQKVKEGKKA